MTLLKYDQIRFINSNLFPIQNKVYRKKQTFSKQSSYDLKSIIKSWIQEENMKSICKVTFLKVEFLLLGKWKYSK